MATTKYPRIPHLAGSLASAGDLVLSARASRAFRDQPADVFEKLDGLNVGFTFVGPGDLRVLSRVRGPLRPADLDDDLWELTSWAHRHQARLFAACGTRYAAFGEWLTFRLGVGYSALPDAVVFFDLLDTKTGRVVPDGKRRLAGAGFEVNRRIGRTRGADGLERFRGSRPYGADRDEGLLFERGARRAKFVWADYRPLPTSRLGRVRNTLVGPSARCRL